MKCIIRNKNGVKYCFSNILSYYTSPSVITLQKLSLGTNHKEGLLELFAQPAGDINSSNLLVTPNLDENGKRLETASVHVRVWYERFNLMDMI